MSKEIDPRINMIIEAVENEKEPVSVSDVAVKLNLEEQLVKNILAEYIKQQTSIRNLLGKGIDPGFFTLAYGLKEFTENKGIQKWVDRYNKMQGGLAK